MKKLILLAVVLGFIVGCGQSAVQSEYYQHTSMYKSWDHLKFSWFGYKDVSPEEAAMSQQQNWWGLDIPHVPGN